MLQDQSSAAAVVDMPTWSPCRLDFYDFYLAQLSNDNSVTTTQPIRGDDGRLLLDVGQRFTSDSLKFLSAHTLSAPLSHCVCIQRPMGNMDFLQHLMNAIRDTELFRALEERKYPLDYLIRMGESLEQFPMVQQRLTVMEAQLNDLFQRTLNASLWALFIAQEMRLPTSEIHSIFWAAITRDFGMMHLPARLLVHEGDLAVDEWRALYSHVAISRQLLCDANELSQAVADAVYEHHERCDGTGYPHGKVESEISLNGQVLALADDIVGIYFNRCKPYGRRWRDVISVLELNRTAYFYRAFEVVNAVLFRSEMPLESVVQGGDMADFAMRMRRENAELHQWFSQINSALTSLGFIHGDRRLHSLQNVALHIAVVFKGAALFEGDLRASLLAIANEHCGTVDKRLEDTLLRQQEMRFHLHRLTHMVQIYVASGECKDAQAAKKLKACLTKISGFL